MLELKLDCRRKKVRFNTIKEKIFLLMKLYFSEF